MAQAGRGRAFSQAVNGLDRRRADVGHGQARQRGERRGRVGLGLQASQLGLFVGHAREVLGAHGGLGGAQSLGLVGVLVAFERPHLGQRPVAALQEHVDHQALEVARAQLAAQQGEVVLVAQVGRGHLVVVEPAGQRRHGQRHAVGHAEVALAHDELGPRERRLHERAVDALLGHGAQGILEGGAEACGGPGLRPAQLHDGERLQHPVGHECLHVVGQAGVQQRALHGRLVAAHERVQQDVHRHEARALGSVAYDVAPARAGVLGGRVHDAHHVLGHHGRLGLQGVRLERRPAGCRALGSAGGLLVGHGGEVLPVQERQHAVQIHVAVQREVAVVQPVVARVLVQELLIGQVGDGTRRTARLEAVGRVGEQRRLQLVVEHGVRVGERALHLVVHHAVEHELRLAVLGLGRRHEVARDGVALVGLRVGGQLVVPALLLEDGALMVDGRVQHRVQVHVREVEQVLVVRACHGIQGLVGERHGVQERLHGALQQVHERLLDGELVRAAQHRVLQYVEHARVVGGRRLERDGERLVGVVVRQVEQPRAALPVGENVCRPVDLGQLLAREHGEPVQLVVR